MYANKINYRSKPEPQAGDALTQIDELVASVAHSLRSTLDTIALIKEKSVKLNKIFPWFNAETHKQKQTARKIISRNSHLTILDSEIEPRSTAPQQNSLP